MTEQPVKKMVSIAVDDEPIALDIISRHAGGIPWLTLAATFTNAFAALDYIKTNSIELVFLDINMPDLSGLEMAGMLASNTKIIFTTAHAEFAVQGFEMAALDYLLKPISFDRFQKACERARDNQQLNTVKHDDLFLKDGHNWIRLVLSDLVYLEASDNYVIFQSKTSRVLIRSTLADAIKKLEGKQFMRVHKSYAVHVPMIDKVERNSISAGGYDIPISAAFREEVLAAIRK